jgi:hypothetical protein
MINANDGGANVSANGGRDWTAQTMPTAQFYHVSTDNSFPYNILGAQQDNSTVRIPSRTSRAGITVDDWTSTAGGESGYVAAKPNNPDIVFGGSYGGSMDWYNHRTGLGGTIDPWPDNPMGHGAIDLVQRFQWTYPIVFSPHNPNVLYTCSQFVLRSTDNGQSWKKISPDLTRNDPTTMGPSGGPITKDNTSVEYYGTVFTIAESPKQRGLIWAGSDDGLIHITQDGGKTWRDVTPKQMPKWGLVSMIDASPHVPGTAYVAVDNHENDDLEPYAYRTTDFGRTWQPITNGIPAESFLRVVREDRRVPGLLYAGTETGMFVSFNDGKNWQSLQMNLPISPIHDLALKEDDLIVATHGRAFWVLDDLSPIQQAKSIRSPMGTWLAKPRDAYRVRWGGRGGPTDGANPLSGVILTYHLAKDVKDLKFEFSWPNGTTFQTQNVGSAKAGLARTSAFLQEPSWTPVPGMIFWGAGASRIVMPSGTYKVKMIADNEEVTQEFRWLRDPRLPSTDRDLMDQYRFSKEIAAMVDKIHADIIQIRTSRTALQEKKSNGGNAADIDALVASLTRVEELLNQTKNQSSQDPLNYPIRLNNRVAALLSAVLGNPNRPTQGARDVFKLLQKEYANAVSELPKLLKEAQSASK